MSLYYEYDQELPLICLIVCEESSHLPVWRATMLAVAEDPLISPTEDTLCPMCRSTCPFICTENTSGSELIPNRCRLTEACAHTLTSEKKRRSLGSWYLFTDLTQHTLSCNSHQHKIKMDDMKAPLK